jgi:hypothetical protein
MGFFPWLNILTGSFSLHYLKNKENHCFTDTIMAAEIRSEEKYLVFTIQPILPAPANEERKPTALSE